MNSHLEEKHEERKEEACDELPESLASFCFQGGVPLDPRKEGDCDDDEPVEWVCLSPAGVCEDCAVFIELILVQDVGEI